MNNKKKVLFLCTNNSCRSQMAEGLLNTIYGNRYQAFSAGVNATSVNPYAVEVMKEIGIDLSKNKSKNINVFSKEQFDYVVTVCNHAKEVCPFFPGKKILHKSFRDPAEFKGSIEELLKEFRSVRNEIKKWIQDTFKE